MVCKDCKDQHHVECENTRHLNSYGSVYGLYGTWCDCQHRKTDLDDDCQHYLLLLDEVQAEIDEGLKERFGVGENPLPLP